MIAPDGSRAAKPQLRARMLAARARLDAETRRTASGQLCRRLLHLAESQDAGVVATYLSIGAEPDTTAAIDALHGRGVRVILPVLRDDSDLDWAALTPGEWRPGPFGLVEPTARPLGVDAIQDADLIVCPGIAGTRHGRRLGRGGGSFDRALARALPVSLRCLLLYDEEVLDDVPTEQHDQLVDVIVTPGGVLRVSRGRFP